MLVLRTNSSIHQLKHPARPLFRNNAFENTSVASRSSSESESVFDSWINIRESSSSEEIQLERLFDTLTRKCYDIREVDSAAVLRLRREMHIFDQALRHDANKSLGFVRSVPTMSIGSDIQKPICCTRELLLSSTSSDIAATTFSCTHLRSSFTNPTLS